MIHCRAKQTGRNLYLFAPGAFVMKVTALHLWSIFTPKSGANAKEREKRMHFDVAQRFGASIAGVKQTSLKLDGVTARGREKAAHLLSKPETGQLSYRAWTRKSRAALRGTALLRANSPKRRCNTSLSHEKRRLATRRHLCCLALHWLSSGRNPVEKGKKQVQVPIFA